MDSSQPPREPEEADPVWDALGERPEPAVAPYFARRVARAAESMPRRNDVLGLLFSTARRRFVTGAAFASAALLIIARPVSTPVVADPTHEMDQETAIEHRTAAIDYVNYFDEILTTEDPSLLSDEDIVALIIDDGSSILLF